jgi:hypothetical protein
MGYGVGQGLERGSANLLNAFTTGMGIQARREEQIANRQIANDRLDIERKRFGMEEKSNLIQQNVANEQLKDLKYQNELLDVDDTLNKIGLNTPRAREFAMNRISPYLQDGIVKNTDGTPRKVLARKHGMAVLNELQKDPTAQLQLDEHTAQDYQDAIEQLKATIPPDADGTDKKTAAVLEKVGQLSKQRDQLTNHILEQKSILMKGVKEAPVAVQGADGTWKWIDKLSGKEVMEMRGMAPETAVNAAATRNATATENRLNRENKLDAARITAGTTMGGAASNIPEGAPGEINPGALQGLSKIDADTVKAIAEYRFPVSNLRNKQMMALVKRAYVYDPTFDAKEYATRAAVRKDFTSGKASQTSLSLNTAVGHLASLSKAATDLDNSSLQLWNTISNKGLAATGDPRTVRFNTAANAVAGELATVFKNTSGTDQEIKSWKDQISTSQSPQQLQASINEAVLLIGSRLEALHNKYEQGLGRKADFQILSAKSRQILKGLGVDVDKYDPASVSKQSSPNLPGGLKSGW